jgi:hypothetical protein
VILLDNFSENFVGLAYQDKDIVFQFIIGYSSLMDFVHTLMVGFWYLIQLSSILFVGSKCFVLFHLQNYLANPVLHRPLQINANKETCCPRYTSANPKVFEGHMV